MLWPGRLEKEQVGHRTREEMGSATRTKPEVPLETKQKWNYPKGNSKYSSGYMILKLRGKEWTRDVNSGVINI